MSLSIGVYCGTFNPFHLGHLNIARKAQRMFDIVYIAKGDNPEKASIARHVHILPKVIEEFIFKNYSTLTTTLLQEIKAYYEKLHHPLFPEDRPTSVSVTLIRGIRNGYDYEYEMTQIQVMKDLMPDLQVVLIPCDREFAHISSSMIRNLAVFDPDAAEKYMVK